MLLECCMLWFVFSPPKKKATLKILCSICFPIVMLSNPVLENPVNLEAAHILMKDETLYMP